MSRKAKIFSPDEVKTLISQAVCRDMRSQPHGYRDHHGSLKMLRNRQVSELTKKYSWRSKQDSTLRDLAFKKFLDVNTHMQFYNLEGLSLPGFSIERPQSRHSKRENILLRARAIMHSVLTPFDEDEWFRCCKHGTGTSIGVPYIDTSIEAKSSLPMTATRRAVPLLERYYDFDSQLKSAVIYFNDATPIGDWYEVVKGSRATTVPKNSSIDRMIAVEPTGNMFLQQGLMAMMYERMRRVGLDLETLPTEHRRRAKIASITSQEATIDWTSASDCVSSELLRWLLPPVWFECCDMVRSPVIQLDEQWVTLSMFSTMGNAVTFPLETLVFWSLAHATNLEAQHTLSHFPEWEDRLVCSVFGDDCIVPSDIAHDFIQVMESVGFIVNKEKSFYDDSGFRESCGGDYLHGYDVRPFYLKEPHSDRRSALEPWLYIITNRLLLKYMVYFGERDYIYAAAGLLGVISGLFQRYELRLKFVPPDYPDDAGLKCVFDASRLLSCYPFVLGRIDKSQHGLLSFTFCKFRYAERTSQFGDIRYALWLKNAVERNVPEITRDEQLSNCYRRKEYSFSPTAQRLARIGRREVIPAPFKPRRRKGGYVVARGDTVHWTVPNVNRR